MGIEKRIHTSELSKAITSERFEEIYKKFIEQADKNVISGKSNGKKVPYGFTKMPIFDGGDFKPKYGQGNASHAPYVNWWVVSVYYVPAQRNISIGIEEGRYSHLDKMEIKPIEYSVLGDNKNRTAIFYSTSLRAVNYEELYEVFLQVCEEVMRLGLC